MLKHCGWRLPYTCCSILLLQPTLLVSWHNPEVKALKMPLSRDQFTCLFPALVCLTASLVDAEYQHSLKKGVCILQLWQLVPHVFFALFAGNPPPLHLHLCLLLQFLMLVQSELEVLYKAKNITKVKYSLLSPCVWQSARLFIWIFTSLFSEKVLDLFQKIQVVINSLIKKSEK